MFETSEILTGYNYTTAKLLGIVRRDSMKVNTAAGRTTSAVFKTAIIVSVMQLIFRHFYEFLKTLMHQVSSSVKKKKKKKCIFREWFATVLFVFCCPSNNP